nr:MAG TPA: hypothetical protein [Caudoviricetes sp.]
MMAAGQTVSDLRPRGARRKPKHQRPRGKRDHM